LRSITHYSIIRRLLAGVKFYIILIEAEARLMRIFLLPIIIRTAVAAGAYPAIDWEIIILEECHDIYSEDRLRITQERGGLF
jgi:hypothetical protein